MGRSATSTPGTASLAAMTNNTAGPTIAILGAVLDCDHRRCAPLT
jgi:hypothetical protein